MFTFHSVYNALGDKFIAFSRNTANGDTTLRDLNYINTLIKGTVCIAYNVTVTLPRVLNLTSIYTNDYIDLDTMHFENDEFDMLSHQEQEELMRIFRIKYKFKSKNIRISGVQLTAPISNTIKLTLSIPVNEYSHGYNVFKENSEYVTTEISLPNFNYIEIRMISEEEYSSPWHPFNLLQKQFDIQDYDSIKNCFLIEQTENPNE